MCFNSPDIQAAVKERASLIGAAITKELDTLKTSGKAHLFAGIIAGWETQIGRDLETDRPLGYRAPQPSGIQRKQPAQGSGPRTSRHCQGVHGTLGQFPCTMQEFLAGSSSAHIAFTSQGLRAADAKESYAVKVHFALPEVAFSSAYRPGFSTYPEGSTFKEIHAVLARNGSPGWISGEGANVSPTTMPGEPNMETYLARMFNHGAVMTNIFSWGIGGEAMRDNFFRKATENPEALAAYAKFLRSEPLTESAAAGFTAAGLQAKMRRIQKDLPAFARNAAQPDKVKVAALTAKVEALLKEQKWLEVDKVADEILSVLSDKP